MSPAPLLRRPSRIRQDWVRTYSARNKSTTANSTTNKHHRTTANSTATRFQNGIPNERKWNRRYSSIIEWWSKNYKLKLFPLLSRLHASILRGILSMTTAIFSCGIWSHSSSALDLSPWVPWSLGYLAARLSFNSSQRILIGCPHLLPVKGERAIML